MYLRTLGSLALEGSVLRRPKPLLLLAYLTLEGGKSRRELARLFFGASRDPRDSLSSAIRHIATAAGEAVDATGALVRSNVSSDAAALLAATRLSASEEIVHLYRGPFLENHALPLGEELEEWVYATREYLAIQVREAHFRLGEQLLVADQLADVARHAEAAYRLPGAPPLDPDAMDRLYRLLHVSRSARLPELRREAEDLGHELVDRSAQPLTRSGNEAPTNLLEGLSPMIGRLEELDELLRLLDRPDHRLVVLHGAAGVGKTRLALEVAASQRATASSPDGVFFISLDALEYPRQMVGAITAALQLPAVVSGAPWIEMGAQLGAKRLLLVLDNFEHMMAAAPHLSTLLRSCPSLKLLVTSRMRLDVEEEWVFPLEGLPVPPAHATVEDAEQVDAVRLFVQRAKQRDLRFTVTAARCPHVVQICRLVDGFPLGIELAAAWVSMLPLDELARELATSVALLESTLAETPSRHRSIRAAFEYSWQLLSPREQQTLRRLAVFQGGFSREAASEVAGATIAMLKHLADKSLIRLLPNGRYDRHLLLCELTHEKLAEEPDLHREMQRQHGAYFTRLLLVSSATRHGSTFPALFALLMEEEPNLLAALEWATVERQATTLRLLSEPLHWYFMLRGRPREGVDIFARTTDQLQDSPTAMDQAHASLLVSHSWLRRYVGDLVESEHLCRRALRLARRSGSELEMVRALDTMGQVLFLAGRYAESRDHLSEALERALSYGDATRLARVLVNLAYARSYLGEHAEARAHWRHAWRLHEEGSVPAGMDSVVTLLCAGVTGLYADSWAEACDACDRGLALAEAMGFDGLLPVFKAVLGLAALELGLDRQDQDLISRAARVGAEGLVAARASGENVARCLLLALDGRLALQRKEFAAAERSVREGLDLARGTGNLTVVFWLLPWLSEIYVAQGKLEHAIQIVSLLNRHPAAFDWARRQASMQIDGLRARLGAEAVGWHLAHAPEDVESVAHLVFVGAGQGP